MPGNKLPTQKEIVNALYDVKTRIDVITKALEDRPNLFRGMYKLKIRAIHFGISHLLKLLDELTGHPHFCSVDGDPYWSCCRTEGPE
jgi:hypothetical protein